MKRQLISIVMLVTTMLAGLGATQKSQPPPTSKQLSGGQDAFFKGTVVEVFGPRLFSIRQEQVEGPDLLVLAPREVSTAKGATVAVTGSVRRVGSNDLKQVRDWSDLNPQLRVRFSGRPVVVATAVLSSEPLQPQPAAQAERESPSPSPSSPERVAMPLSLPASMLVDFIQTFAGQPVRIQNARVVGLIGPSVFLVEPATRYLKDMGTRDRVAVFVDGGTIRVAAELLVGSIVELEGVARSVLSVHAAGDLEWPAKLTPQLVERLEIRAAILATSVHTAEGTELTDRTAGRNPKR
jgi:hypothetical protein